MALSSDYYGAVLNGLRLQPEKPALQSYAVAETCPECLFLISAQEALSK